MCGIAGIWDGNGRGEGSRDTGHVSVLAGLMADALSHRGPDDRGVWADPGYGLALGHRRLSIVDLSEAGHQPMLSEEGRYVLSLNGEIYNFPELRRELDGSTSPPNWRGHSDTEVLLAAIVRWGLVRTLERATGMFAFALWDRREHRLALVRDRFGEKPLYFGLERNRLLFASELKAFRAVPDWRGEIDRNSIASLLQLSAIASPQTIYRGVHQLEPGTWIEFSPETLDSGSLPEPKTWWSLGALIERAKSDPFQGDEESAVSELEDCIQRSVARQMVADVPLGAFLSGGIDSSCIVALMQAQSARPIRTFTIGFSDPEYDEALYARRISDHLGTDHTELYVTPEEAQAVIPELAGIYDEPFADASQIPTILVSRLARAHVTVSLSGDAGDELFGGYNRYVWGRGIVDRLGWMPRPVRRGLGGLLTAIPPEAWDAGAAGLRTLSGGRLDLRAAGDRAHKYAALLPYETSADLYDRLFSQWSPIETGLPGHAWPPAPGEVDGIPEQMMYWDATGFLRDDILTKVDRAAMSVGLETRIPLLDPEVAEFAWRLPLAFKIHGGIGKSVLRKVAYRHVPRALLERPKMGFRVPLDHWLRGPLHDWADALLSTDRLRREGFLDPKPIRRAWDEHRSGRRNWQYKLWAVLMLEAWFDRHHPGGR